MTAYFIAASGNDSNTGTTTSAPWKTVGKVNKQKQAPGDVYSFRGGDTFSDATLLPIANNTTFTSYGVGNATISQATNDGLTLTNLSGVTISNLNFTGSASSTTAVGIRCLFPSGGYNDLDLLNLTVSNFGSDGIRVSCLGGGFLDNLVINSCTVFNCTFGDSNPSPPDPAHPTNGIGAYGKFGADLTGVYNLTNVTISNCVSRNNPGNFPRNPSSGNGIYLAEVKGGLITDCVAHDNGGTGVNNFCAIGIWFEDCRNITVQYCESYNNQNPPNNVDAGGFDIDGGNKNCIVQYCYSHNNSGNGFLEFIANPSPGGLTSGTNSNNVIRFCVSQGDAVNSQGDQGGLAVGVGSSGQIVNGSYYGNTIFGSTAAGFNGCFHYTSLAGVVSGIVANNIFYSGANNIQLTSNPSFGGTQLQFRGNCYFAAGTFAIEYPSGTLFASLAAFQSATGQEKLGGVAVGLQANPGLTSAGNGGTANVNGVITPDLLAGVSAYSITSSSAVFKKGLNTNLNFGIPLGGQNDFYGNLLADSSLSIGADCLGANAPVSRNGNLIYLFQFPSAAAANADIVIGEIGFVEVLVYGDLSVNSTTPNSGFWCQIAQNAEINTVLAAHPNLQLIFNQSQLASASGRSVIFTKIPTTHIGIIVNAFSNFITNGLS